MLFVGRLEIMNREFRGRWVHIGDPEYDEYLRGSCAGRQRCVVDRRPRRLHAAPYYVRGEQLNGEPWPEDVPAHADRWNALLRGVAAEVDATVVDFDRKTGPEGKYQDVVDGVQLRYVGVHFRGEVRGALQPAACCRGFWERRAPEGGASARHDETGRLRAWPPGFSFACVRWCAACCLAP
ncbi:MAG: hypothetical protein M3P48_10470 [Actinomycetota bacterium]|nr:hypothetical protein [Actinomycetota bacterium]